MNIVMNVRFLFSIMMSLSCANLVSSSCGPIIIDKTQTQKYRENLAKFNRAPYYGVMLSTKVSKASGNSLQGVQSDNAVLKEMLSQKARQKFHEAYSAYWLNASSNLDVEQKSKKQCIQAQSQYEINLTKFNALPPLSSKLISTQGLTGVALIKADERNVRIIDKIARDKEKSLQAVYHHPELSVTASSVDQIVLRDIEKLANNQTCAVS